MSEKRTERETDVLVVGTGLAGLRAAIEARRVGQQVLLIDKNLIGINNNTALAGGGFKAALPGFLDTSVEKQYDTPDQHFSDTVMYGEYVADQSLVETLSLEAPAHILELQEFNIPHFEALCTYGMRKPMILADGSATVDANPSRGGQVVDSGARRRMQTLRREDNRRLHPTCVAHRAGGNRRRATLSHLRRHIHYLSRARDRACHRRCRRGVPHQLLL